MSLSNVYSVGLNNVGSYQVSGVPFVTGSLTAPANTGTALKIEFPYVTRWISIANSSSHHIRFGFSAAGTSGSNHFIVHEDNHPTQNGPYELKCTELYIMSNDGSDRSGVYVMAGLTNIPVARINNLSGSGDVVGNNWSGSVGVG